MPRRFLFMAAVVATLLAACSGTSSQPALTDPKDILTNAVSSLQGVKTVHVEASLSGKINPGALTGGGSGGGVTVDLSNTSLKGDIDIADQEAHLTVAVPALLNFSAELIATGGNAYVKTSLSGDDKFHKVDTSSLTNGLPIPSIVADASATPNPSAVAAAIDQLKAELDKLTTPPTKLADEKIGDQDCYHVQFKVTPADMSQVSGAAASGAPASGALANGSVTVDVWSRKSDYRPARISLAIDTGGQGTLTATIDLTNYDAPVVVTPPSPDQISDQPLSLPGITQ